MKRAFVNGIILDGTENMIPQHKKAILVDGGVIKDIVEDTEVPAD